ncbi:MAG: hypothetical protein WCD18_26820 [Thermosynechococcaceae cyanobacterium]
MSQTSEPHEIFEIIMGFLLLCGLHVLAGMLIFGLGFLASAIFGGYSFAPVWMVGSMGFLFWQLLYVLPLINWLKRRGKIGMMKGVIIGAVLTALLNGSCALMFLRPWG